MLQTVANGLEELKLLCLMAQQKKIPGMTIREIAEIE